MKNLLLSLSHVLGRYGLWQAAIAVLWHCGPLDELDRGAQSRLHYCMLMSRDSQRSRAMYTRLLRRDLDRSAATNSALASMAQLLGRNRLAVLLDRRTLRQTALPTSRAAAQVMIDFNQQIVSGEIDTTVAAMVDDLLLVAGEEVVLITGSGGYLDIFELWLGQARNHVTGRILGMAMDKVALHAMQEVLGREVIDLSAYFVFDQNGKIEDRTRQLLWMLRVMLLREIVGRGHRLLSIDLDAVPLADLAPMLDRLPPADIVAQRDYSIPMDVARKLGFVLCCGFMVFSPTEATISFLDRYANRTIRELDDQLALNHLIAEAGVKDVSATPESMSFRADGVQWVCPDKSLVSRELTSGAVVRHFTQRDQSIDQLRSALGLPPRVTHQESAETRSVLGSSSL